VTSLTELREAGERATPGPWASEPDTGAGRVWVQRKRTKYGALKDMEPLFNVRGHDAYRQREADAALVVLARNNWDALLDVVEAAEQFKRADEDAANLAGVGAYDEEDERRFVAARGNLFSSLVRFRDTQDTTA
jgi:hypothetical protein